MLPQAAGIDRIRIRDSVKVDPDPSQKIQSDPDPDPNFPHSFFLALFRIFKLK